LWYFGTIFVEFLVIATAKRPTFNTRHYGAAIAPLGLAISFSKNVML
jgi:hypothetical protein